MEQLLFIRKFEPFRRGSMFLTERSLQAEKKLTSARLEEQRSLRPIPGTLTSEAFNIYINISNSHFNDPWKQNLTNQNKVKKKDKLINKTIWSSLYCFHDPADTLDITSCCWALRALFVACLTLKIAEVTTTTCLQPSAVSKAPQKDLNLDLKSYSWSETSWAVVPEVQTRGRHGAISDDL